jgi:8-oxo-dGTP pyrophosphatase MutT (NUDIX family)
MTIWVDVPIWPAHGRHWCHVISDESLVELHDFARRAGIPQRSFEGDHYDLPEDRWQEVVDAGARPTSGQQVARLLRDSGLRFPKRRGERPLGRFPDGLAWLGLPHTLDVVASPHEPAPTTSAAVVIVSTAAREEIVMVRSVGRDGWAPPGGKRDVGESVREGAVREVAEETGLLLAPEALTPVGYERIVVQHGHGTGTWRDGVNLLAVLAARVPSRASVSPLLDDVLEARWATRREAEDLAGHEPWWALVDWWWERSH